ANQHPALGAALGDRPRHALGVIRIVVARNHAIRAAVHDLVTCLPHDGHETILERKARMVRPDGDLHRLDFISSVVGAVACSYTRREMSAMSERATFSSGIPRVRTTST